MNRGRSAEERMLPDEARPAAVSGFDSIPAIHGCGSISENCSSTPLHRLGIFTEPATAAHSTGMRRDGT